jgi:hypothetical protein
MLAFLGIPDWFWHPLQNGNGYNFWSGFGSDLGEVTLVTAIVAGFFGAYRHHNCHVKRCWRPGHIDPAVGAPACSQHHSQGHKHGVSWHPNHVIARRRLKG